MLESLNYSFRNPKKHSLSDLPHHTVEKLQKNHGVLRGPQVGKQLWRPRLGILRVNGKRWQSSKYGRCILISDRQCPRNRGDKKCANCDHLEKCEIWSFQGGEEFNVAFWFSTHFILTSAYSRFGSPCYYSFYSKDGAYTFLLHHNHRYY